MKRNHILLSAFVALALLLGSPIAKAQQTYFLNVDSIIGIPDTVYDGSTVTFTMVFSNVSNRTLDAVVQGPATVNLAGY